MAEKLKVKTPKKPIEPTKVQLITWEENDTVKQYFNKVNVRKFFNPYFKSGKEFQKIIQDVSTAYYKSKDLQKCKKNQILQSVVDCLNLGLTIDKREHAYLVPRPWYLKKDGKRTHKIGGYSATLQIGWRGYVYKVSQQYPDFNIDNIGFVRKEDEFSTELVNGMRNISHKPVNIFNNTINTIIGAYCTISYTKGKRVCEQTNFMSIEKINKSKNISTMKDYTWKQWPFEMMKKTIIRNICKINFASITKKLDDFDNQFFNLNKKLNKTAGLEELNNQTENE